MKRIGTIVEVVGVFLLTIIATPLITFNVFEQQTQNIIIDLRRIGYTLSQIECIGTATLFLVATIFALTIIMVLRILRGKDFSRSKMLVTAILTTSILFAQTDNSLATQAPNIVVIVKKNGIQVSDYNEIKAEVEQAIASTKTMKLTGESTSTETTFSKNGDLWQILILVVVAVAISVATYYYGAYICSTIKKFWQKMSGNIGSKQRYDDDDGDGTNTLSSFTAGYLPMSYDTNVWSSSGPEPTNTMYISFIVPQSGTNFCPKLEVCPRDKDFLSALTQWGLGTNLNTASYSSNSMPVSWLAEIGATDGIVHVNTGTTTNSVMIVLQWSQDAITWTDVPYSTTVVSRSTPTQTVRFRWEDGYTPYSPTKFYRVIAK